MSLQNLKVPSTKRGLSLHLSVIGSNTITCALYADKKIAGSIAYAMAQRSRCHIYAQEKNWSLWLDGAAFDLHQKDVERIAAALEIPVHNHPAAAQ